MNTHSIKLSVADKFDTPQKKTLKNKNFMRTITFKRNKKQLLGWMFRSKAECPQPSQSSYFVALLHSMYVAGCLVIVAINELKDFTTITGTFKKKLSVSVATIRDCYYNNAIVMDLGYLTLQHKE